ncbi:MAG: VCBS repeat-containing protein [Actinomycetota bacterium]|nr:VCBS repeat-containing protein [Actinomycetota bacterium]
MNPLEQRPDLRRTAGIVLLSTVVGLLAATVPLGPVNAAPEEQQLAAPAPTSASDVAAQVGLYQVTKSWSANVGDFDADGDPDLMYVPHNESASRLYRNDGGLFSEVFAGTFRRRDRHDCAWGDVNTDGRLDLYCSLGASSGTGYNPKELWIQQTGGGFVDRAVAYGVTDPYGRGRMATFIDVNHDPYPDLFVGNEYPRQDGIPVSNHLYINQEGTSFAAAPGFGLDVEVGGLCAQAADIDRDGWEDLLVCGQTGLHLYRNDGGTGFTEITGAWGVGSLASGFSNARLADFTGDGKLDLALVKQTSLVVLPQGASSFGPISFQLALKAGRWIAAGDFQGDGALDLFVVQKCRNGINDPDHLLLGDGTGASFSEVALPQTTQGCGDVVEPIDYNGDGNDEFIVLNGLGDTTQGPAPSN